jgi:transcriptional regulator with XRE-family HTH domain
MQDPKQLLGDQLREVRVGQGLSLARAGQLAGISAAYLQKLERGLVRNPSPRILERVAEALALDYLELMELIGYLEPSRAAARRPPRPMLVTENRAEPLTADEAAALSAFLMASRNRPTPAGPGLEHGMDS